MFVEGGYTTKTAEFSKKGFVAWLRQHNPEDRFEYYDTRNCLNAQFHKACGKTYRYSICINSLLFWRLGNKIENIAVCSFSFGDALKQVEAKGWG